MTMTNFPIPNAIELANGQTIVWNATTGKFDPVDLPGSVGPSCVVAQCAGPDNLFALDADQGDFVIVTGDEFAIVQAGTGWALTEEGCILTYTGSLTNRALIIMDISVQGDVIGDSCNMGIAVDGDLIGLTPGYQQSVMFWSPIDGINTITMRRIVTLADGLTIQPVASGATAASAAVSRLILSAIIL